MTTTIAILWPSAILAMGAIHGLDILALGTAQRPASSRLARLAVRHTLVALALASSSSATAQTYELPRATSTATVSAMVECLGDPETGEGCTVRHKCASPTTWAAGIEPADFDSRPDLAPGRLGFLPTNASGTRLCAVHTEGRANITAFRYHRRRPSAAEPWEYLSRETLPVHRAGTIVTTRMTAPTADSFARYALTRFGYATLQDWAEDYCHDQGYRTDSTAHANCLTTETRLWELSRCDPESRCDISVYPTGIAALMPLTDYGQCLVDQSWEFYEQTPQGPHAQPKSEVLRINLHGATRLTAGGYHGYTITTIAYQCAGLLGNWTLE